MKRPFLTLLLSVFALSLNSFAAAAEKPRVFVLTDIENEPEAGTLSVATGRSGEPLTIEGANARDASFAVPKNFLKAGTMHIILAVTDNGTPALTRYRRVIVTVPAT